MQFPFTLWQAIEPIYAAILQHPFMRELINGNLSLDIFQYYLKQDAIYLQRYSQILTIIGEKLLQPEFSQMFLRFSKAALLEAENLHAKILTDKFSEEGEISPCCQAYTDYLLDLAHLDDVAVAVAAVLPCFWIYQKLGTYIATTVNLENHAYASWIKTYSAPEFLQDTNSVIAIVDQMSVSASAHTQEKMLQAFIQASRYEWMFWDSAYRLGVSLDA